MKIYEFDKYNYEKVALAADISIDEMYKKLSAVQGHGFLFVRGSWEDEMKEDPNRVIDIVRL
jgi:hypothetical protein